MSEIYFGKGEYMFQDETALFYQKHEAWFDQILNLL